MTCLRIFLRGLYHDLKEAAGIALMLIVAIIPTALFVVFTHPEVGEDTVPGIVLGWALLMLFILMASLQFATNLYYAWRHTDIERIVEGRHTGEREVAAAEMRAIDDRLARCDYTEIRKRGDDCERLHELRRRFHRS
jgi:hypothetical protein